MKKKKILFILLLLIIILIYLYNYHIKTHTVKKIIPDLFDTYFEITIVGRNPLKLSGIIKELIYHIKHAEEMYNYFDGNSHLNRLNNDIKNDYVNISEDLYNLIKTGYHYEKISNRKFSILTGNYKDLYTDYFFKKIDFDLFTKKIEHEHEIWDKSKILFKKKSIKIVPGNIKIDLGSVAKGWIVDKCVEFAQNFDNVYAGIINGGGDLRVFSKQEYKKWRIGIQHPRNSNEYLDIISLYNGSIATSGDYQRYVTIDEKRFHHIIDTSTGFSADNNISATVITEKCINADILSTLFFVMTEEEIQKFIKTNNINAEYLIVDKENNLFGNYYKSND